MTPEEIVRMLRQGARNMREFYDNGHDAWDQAADLIEQQAATIARLSAPLSDHDWDNWCSMRHAIDAFLQERLNGQ